MSVRPLIFVSNDDGYSAKGVQLLAEALEPLGEVWVVAPERERSASSHAITLHKPLRIKRIADRRFWCSGSPTDCTYVALNSIVPRKPDLMVSGINHGPNLGDDVTYSGTVGAAMEGTLLGVPSIATSLTGIEGRPDFTGALALVTSLARDVLEHGLPEHILLNVNVPCGYDATKGMRATKLGRRHYGREVEEREDPRGKRYVWIGGTEAVFIDSPGSDVNANQDGIASVSPILVDATASSFVPQLASWGSVSNV
ncbi:MAG: 5'-nucleotidase [Bradymonadia bacterium]|jgi:5'-nucleotidase